MRNHLQRRGHHDVSPWQDSEASPVLRLRNEMDRLFHDFFRGIVGNEPAELLSSAADFVPDIDLRETDTNYEITVELPGLSKDDVDVRVENDRIILSGEKRREAKEEEGAWRCNECYYGRFERMVALPGGVDADKVDATFKNGVLHISVPKRQIGASGKHVEIKAA